MSGIPFFQKGAPGLAGKENNKDDDAGESKVSFAKGTKEGGSTQERSQPMYHNEDGFLLDDPEESTDLFGTQQGLSKQTKPSGGGFAMFQNRRPASQKPAPSAADANNSNTTAQDQGFIQASAQPTAMQPPMNHFGMQGLAQAAAAAAAPNDGIVQPSHPPGGVWRQVGLPASAIVDKNHYPSYATVIAMRETVDASTTPQLQEPYTDAATMHFDAVGETSPVDTPTVRDKMRHDQDGDAAMQTAHPSPSVPAKMPHHAAVLAKAKTAPKGPFQGENVVHPFPVITPGERATEGVALSWTEQHNQEDVPDVAMADHQDTSKTSSKNEKDETWESLQIDFSRIMQGCDEILGSFGNDYLHSMDFLETTHANLLTLQGDAMEDLHELSEMEAMVDRLLETKAA